MHHSHRHWVSVAARTSAAAVDSRRTGPEGDSRRSPVAAGGNTLVPEGPEAADRIAAGIGVLRRNPYST